MAATGEITLGGQSGLAVAGDTITAPGVPFQDMHLITDLHSITCALL